MVEIVNAPLSLDALLPGREDLLEREVSRACKLPVQALRGCKVSRKSVDARKRSNVHFVVSVALDDDALSDWLGSSAEGGGSVGLTQRALHEIAACLPKGISVREGRLALPLAPLSLSHIANVEGFKRPMVVGAGPAGLFCALYLARAGLRPLVVERGGKVEERARKVKSFFATGKLDPECNVQFGEGGAGTFSDGKLTTGTKSAHIRSVLREFVDAGAPNEILVDAKPHIGTDLLGGVVRNIRREVERLGGEFMFNVRLDDVKVDDGRVSRVRLVDLPSQSDIYIEADSLVLAVGHSARDTYEMLRRRGFVLERKPFAMGVRVEHLQVDVNRAQYGKAAGHPALGAADYKLAVHNADGRGVYTFCMCPGGTVVAAASEPGGVCVNGMSIHARDGRNANSALLVEVRPEDLPGEDPFEGIRLQRSLERAAFAAAAGVPVDGRAAAGDSAYKAPAQTIGGFMQRASDDGRASVSPDAASRATRPSAKVEPTYPRAVSWTDLHECLPEWMTAAMEEALPALDRKLLGFADPEAVMTAVEARSSAPVRVLRDRESLQAVGCAGVYPAGEGAGYAGGIMSSAVDGIRCAEKIVAALQVPNDGEPLLDAGGSLA